MKNNKKFETVYKLRFLPLVVTGIILIITSLLKYALRIEVGKFFGWSVFLTFAGFIYYRAVLEQKNKKEKEENSAENPPPPTKEEIQKKYEDEMQIAIDRQKNNIVIRSIYLFFCILLTLGGLSVIFSGGGDRLFGTVISITGILFTGYSIFVLRKWIIYLKTFKEEKKKKVFEEETD